MTNAVDPNWVVHDLDALAANFSEVRRRVGPDQGIFAAIKGNAYGHGALPVARCLEHAGAAGCMTGSFDEALLLRENGVGLPVVLFAGALASGMPELIGAGLIPTIVDMAAADAVASVATPEAPADVYVKVDMGLGRIGVPSHEIEAFLSALSQKPALNVAGLYTHLPFGDNAGREWASGRFRAFDDLLGGLDVSGLLPPVTQAGASSSVAVGLADRASSVCVGHLLFGLTPFADSSVADISAFKPVICELGSRLIQVTAHRQGDDVAIAGMFGLRQGKRVGVAPIGAAHGLQRPAPGTVPMALVRGKRVPIIAVSLEHLTVDLDGVDGAEAGDTVLLLGSDGATGIDLEEFAGWSGMSCLDAVLALSERLPAQYRGGAEGG